MNGQLPPVDPGIREHLTRRSAGRPPLDLVAAIEAALDAAPAPRARSRWPRVAWRTPRFAGAGIGVALLLILAVGIAGPAFHTRAPGSFPGYPGERALTTAELASMLAEPVLTANTTVVASVTIDSRQDVCPMNSRMTFGVIQGIDPQVCVVGAINPGADNPAGSGTFAFRILSRGVVMLAGTSPSNVLGLLGEITPASNSRLAFRVAEEWPLAGKTFLVEGWLGQVKLGTYCLPAQSGGDVLAPDGSSCGNSDWLSADATAPSIEAEYGSGSITPTPSPDPLSLRGNARHVEAGGMRLIDSVDPSAPVHGTFVVRSVTEGCPGDPPISSRGCPAWRVLAKVPDISAPVPTMTPTEIPSPTSTAPAVPMWDPSQRALTSAELGRVLGSGKLAKYQIVVADATMSPAPTGACAAADTLNVGGFGMAIAGVVAGLDPPVCVYTDENDKIPPTTDGLVLSSIGPRRLGYMGSLTAAAGRLAFKAAEDWPRGFFLVDAWLDFEVADCRHTSMPGSGGSDPLHPDGFSCVAIMRDSQPPDKPSPDPQAVGPTATSSTPPDGKQVNALPSLVSPAPGLLSVPESVHGVFLVHYDPLCSLSNPTDCEQWQVIGQVDPLDLSPTPTP
jgi:hypothetical protein